ncbi:DUF1501 domain-containing protein [Caballeronia humi]|uniref:Twin-arginine translocation pathway signal sequence domain-containing protein n=1 Tax=Caballeronia humi TaxID=326474 RepID=A0A158HKR7_9BURK|nr:DUF1501 domain-containing protein [Caballeronia humi]SAL44609.1 twin-arginine translocation pathway signal sequence domain-containing protein [Caballeronia humi]
MNRRQFLSTSGALLCLPGVGFAATKSGGAPKTLILVELKGGNDGLNTVVPFSDPAYRALRPTIGIARDKVLQLDERTGLHPATAPLLPLWRDGELAVVQGVGYAQPNLSHFRSMEIWDTASRSDQYLRDGWLARALGRARNADAVAIGSFEAGPFASASGSRFVDSLAVKTSGAFEASINHLANNPLRRELTVLRLTLNGFDTHQNQPARHAALLAELSEGFVTMRRALTELGRWDETLVVTYSEFGRRARENQSGGTEHGTAAPLFVAGGRVRGGLYGAPPKLARLDGNGNLPIAVDFRQIYATVLGSWLDLDAASILQQRFDPLPLINAYAT